MTTPVSIGPPEVYLFIDLLKNPSIMPLGIFLVFELCPFFNWHFVGRSIKLGAYIFTNIHFQVVVFSVYLKSGDMLQGNMTIQYGPVPEAGSCTVQPESGYALTTQFNVTCTGFTVTGGLDMKYSIYSSHKQEFIKGMLHNSLSRSIFKFQLRLHSFSRTYWEGDILIFVWIPLASVLVSA